MCTSFSLLPPIIHLHPICIHFVFIVELIYVNVPISSSIRNNKIMKKKSQSAWIKSKNGHLTAHQTNWIECRVESGEWDTKKKNANNPNQNMYITEKIVIPSKNVTIIQWCWIQIIWMRTHLFTNIFAFFFAVPTVSVITLSSGNDVNCEHVMTIWKTEFFFRF